LLEGIVDIYLPDLKYAENDAGFTYSKVRGYTDFARKALKEMYRQTGENLVFDENGLLKKGLVIRMLVLPNDLAGIEENLVWIKENLSPQVAISLMAQYYATNKAESDSRYILLSRKISEREWFKAVSLLEELGFEEGKLNFDKLNYAFKRCCNNF
jgi:putative pyruvate formate lyase activating enzyme